MANRVIRSDILTSDTVNSLTWAGEIFYRRLMSVVDDYGRYDGRAKILRGALYSLKLDKVSEADVEKWMGECSKAGLVSFYQIDGKPYLEILKFNQTVRIKKPKFPAPASRCKQMQADASNCMSGVGVETETETETGDGDGMSSSPSFFSDEQLQKNQSAFSPAPPAAGFPQFEDIAAVDMLTHLDASKCLDLYFSAQYYTRTRETVAMRHFIDENILRDWAECFNVYLLKSGKPKKTLQDWATHFSNWLPKQDLSKNPKTIYNYEQPPDKKATGGLNSDYKRKLAERMAAASGKG